MKKSWIMKVYIIHCPKPKERSAKLRIKVIQASLTKCTTTRVLKVLFVREKKRQVRGLKNGKKLDKSKEI